MHYSDDPQPTMLNRDQMPRRASSPCEDGIPAVDQNTQNFLSPIENPSVPNTSVGNHEEAASETQVNESENAQFSSDNIQQAATPTDPAQPSSQDPNLASGKSESPANDPNSPEDGPADENNVAQRSGDDLQNGSGDPVQTESFEANPVSEEIDAEPSEEDVLKDSSEAVLEQGLKRKLKL